MREERELNIVLVDLPAKNNHDVIETLGRELVEKGYVKSEYIDAVKAREVNYPTGLNVQGDVKVAIPHADSCYVNESHIAFASLQQPVSFQNMEDPQSQIQIKLVFMLAIKDPSQQVGILQKLMELFQDTDVLKQLSELQDQEKVKDIIENKIYDKESKL